MFDAVTHTRVQARTGTGALLSVFVHAAVVAGALFLLRPHGTSSDSSPPAVVFHPGPPRAALAPSAPAAHPPPPKPHPTARRHPTALRPPTPNKVTAPQPLAEVVASPVDDGDAKGDATASVGAQVGSGTGTGTGSGGGSETLSLGMAGLTPPALSTDAPVDYPMEARAASVQGTVLVKCRINADGVPEGCHVLKGLPFVNEAVVASLQRRRYTPARYEGHAVAVTMVITVRLKLGR